MGKFEEDQSLPSSSLADTSNSNQNVISQQCSKLSKFVRLKCIVVLLFSIAVLLSAIFWLPPFSHFRHRSDLDLDSLIRAHDVVASFKLRRPVSMLKSNIPQIELDIFDEIAVPNSTVVVIYLEPLAESNSSNVVFAVVPNSKSSHISSASLSLLKSTFLSLVLGQSSLRLTSSLFGDPLSFEVLKFSGGITVIPQQTAFLLQKQQTFFTFRLNSSIHQIQENFGELKNQLKDGLHLTSYENIYVVLINSYGSTVAPPTTVQASVLLAIGNRPPSPRRLKQLARTITGPHARNLGLNHTVFGKVKQVRLSSDMQHSLDSGGSNRPWSPSPAPLPHPSHQHHHHQHHHHHHHHHDVHLAPSPAPVRSYHAKPPFGCRNGFIGKKKKHLYVAPAVAPVVSPRRAAASHFPHVDNPPAPAPAPAPNLPGSSPSLSPSPSVVITPIHPPKEDIPAAGVPNTTPSPSPLPSSSAGLIRWPVAVVLLLAVHIL